ncbi:STAS domain-containing protein [Hahella aquimaris]|uniref:STAS domain-containing protein n=1 Tax=unclassified Hahella TaxID=2624107 RepID=UPI001C1F0953|nr:MULTISPECIES: STAS domain-containing protein [unclassified Hahella]MBU6954487.1 STAS domain-containing protein [Hahella sp. HN01]MDG9667827.1 STAS domain-containing protein [Hahella sp. CR1]WLQ16828.1 STAS domain-containing protein [Hahella sp. HNIBRBA332]
MSGYKILQAEKQGVYVLKFIGEIRLNLCSTLDHLIDEMKEDQSFITVVIDLTETSIVDSTTLGLLAKIGIFAKKHRKILPTIVSTNEDITRLVLSMGFDQLFIIVEKAATDIEHLSEIPILLASEQEVREKVLAAHKVLMELNESNRAAFKDLVQALECDQGPASSVSY